MARCHAGRPQSGHAEPLDGASGAVSLKSLERWRPWCAANALHRASCCTSIPRSCAASRASAAASPGTARNRNQGIGYDAAHLAIDDQSRASFAAIKSDGTSASCTQFLRKAVARYARLGVRSERVMTVNCGLQEDLRCGLRRTGHTPHPHTPLSTRDKRQGRAFRADQPARMSLSQPLRKLNTARSRSVALHPPLQTGIGHTSHRAISRP